MSYIKKLHILSCVSRIFLISIISSTANFVLPWTVCVGAGVSRRALFEQVKEEEEEEDEEEDGLDDWEQIDEDEIKLGDGKIVVALLRAPDWLPSFLFLAPAGQLSAGCNSGSSYCARLQGYSALSSCTPIWDEVKSAGQQDEDSDEATLCVCVCVLCH